MTTRWAAAMERAASRSTGDPVWRLPLWDALPHSWLDSPVADLNNVSAKPIAGATRRRPLSCAEFVSPRTTPWLHFDMYAWNDARPAPAAPKAARRRRCAPSTG
jgi:leucyl aminopeptidase